jgi:hypothetical protein
VDNTGLSTFSGSTPLRSVGQGTISALTATMLTDDSADFPLPDVASGQPGLIGLELDPDITDGDASTFTIIDNTATTITVDAADGDLTTVAAVGDSYIGVYTFDNLRVRGQAGMATDDNVTVLGDLELYGGALITTKIVADTIVLENNSTISHPSSTKLQENRLEIIADQVSIDETSKIDVTSRGYLGGWSGDNDSYFGVTLGNTTSGGSDIYSGGSYGGLGFAPDGSQANAVYGDHLNPDELGSGGGGDTAGEHPGGSGGGLVGIYANNITLDGNIHANGGSSAGGGGSGGGVFIDANVLTGIGFITVDGGDSTYGGGGGGGRAAIHVNDISGFDVSGISVFGGYGSSNGDGAAGTIYISSDADCACDFNGDGDVDGSDFAAFIVDPKGLLLETFAADFGKTNCP